MSVTNGVATARAAQVDLHPLEQIGLVVGGRMMLLLSGVVRSAGG